MNNRNDFLKYVLQTMYTAFGLMVQWDRKQSVRVTVPVDKYEQTCGICGRFNDNRSDDIILGPADRCIPDGVTKAKPGDMVSME